MVSRFVPAGNYVVVAKTGLNTAGDDAVYICKLYGGTTELDEAITHTHSPESRFGSLGLTGTVSFADGGTVEVACRASSDDDTSAAYASKIIATKVTTVH